MAIFTASETGGDWQEPNCGFDNKLKIIKTTVGSMVHDRERNLWRGTCMKKYWADYTSDL